MILSWGAVARWCFPVYNVGKKWEVAPESSAPSAGGGSRLSQTVLHALKAAGKQGDGLLGLKSNRILFGLMWGTK